MPPMRGSRAILAGGSADGDEDDAGVGDGLDGAAGGAGGVGGVGGFAAPRAAELRMCIYRLAFFLWGGFCSGLIPALRRKGFGGVDVYIVCRLCRASGVSRLTHLPARQMALSEDQAARFQSQ